MGQQITLGTVAAVSHQRRPADAQERERAPVGLGVRRRARARPGLGGRTTCARRGRERQARARHERRLLRASSSSWSAPTRGCKVVVPATLLIIFVLLYLTFSRIDEALLIMATLPFALIGGVWFLYLHGLQPVGGHRRGLHRAGRRGGRVRRGHAAVPEARAAATPGRRRAAVARGGRRRHPRRRGAARAAQGDDGGGDPGRPGADRLGQRHRLAR